MATKILPVKGNAYTEEEINRYAEESGYSVTECSDEPRDGMTTFQINDDADGDGDNIAEFSGKSESDQYKYRLYK